MGAPSVVDQLLLPAQRTHRQARPHPPIRLAHPQALGISRLRPKPRKPLALVITTVTRPTLQTPSTITASLPSIRTVAATGIHPVPTVAKTNTTSQPSTLACRRPP